MPGACWWPRAALLSFLELRKVMGRPYVVCRSCRRFVEPWLAHTLRRNVPDTGKPCWCPMPPQRMKMSAHMLEEARKKGAKLLARFGSELKDDRILVLALLAQAGPLDLNTIADALGLAVATAGPLVDQLLQGCMVTLVGAAYDINTEQFETLVANLTDAEPYTRGRS